MKHTIAIATTALILLTNTASAAIQTEGDWGSATFYGSLRLLITQDKNGDTDIADGVSRIGLKGIVNLSDTWQGTYRLEARMLADSGQIISDDSDFHKRLTYIGLKNEEFGEFRIGKQYSPHFLWTIDPTYTTVEDVRYSSNKNSSLREANSISYFSPKYNGFSLGMLAEIDKKDDESSSVDSYNIAAKYNNGPWQGAVSFLSRTDNLRINGVILPDADTTAATLQYKENAHKVVIRYQHEDISDSKAFTTLGAYYSYAFNNYKGLEAKVRINNLDNGTIDGNEIVWGLTKNFDKAGQIFIEYITFDDDASILEGGKDDHTIVGYTLNF